MRDALGWLESTEVRRDFLHLVADRTAATTGRSDVDVLVAIVEWETPFLAGEEPGEVAFDVLTEDLSLNRAARGIVEDILADPEPPAIDAWPALLREKLAK